MSDFISLVTGHLSREARIWTAIGPALALMAYFLIALIVFGVLTLLKRMPQDAEVVKRGKTMLLGYGIRHFFFWAIQPLWRLVLWSGVSATTITTLAALIGIASGFAVAAGRFALGGWLFLFAGVLDTMDGRLAGTRNEVTPRGAAIDSILDRYTDAALVMGLAWYYRGSWILLPGLLALVGGFLVPYVRAKGEGLGVAVRGGTLQRPERVVILGASVALSPVLAAALDPTNPHPVHEPAVLGLVFVAAGSNLTAISRFSALLRALSGGKGIDEPVKPAIGVIAAAATVADFLLVMFLVQGAGFDSDWATAAGALAGAALCWLLVAAARLAGGDAPWPRTRQFLLLAAVGAALNAGGVAVLTMQSLPDYRIAWWVTRLAVVVLWGHPLHSAVTALAARPAGAGTGTVAEAATEPSAPAPPAAPPAEALAGAGTGSTPGQGGGPSRP